MQSKYHILRKSSEWKAVDWSSNFVSEEGEQTGGETQRVQQLVFDGGGEALDVFGGVLDGAGANVGVAGHGAIEGGLLLAVSRVGHGRSIKALGQGEEFQEVWSLKNSFISEGFPHLSCRRTAWCPWPRRRGESRRRRRPRPPPPSGRTPSPESCTCCRPSGAPPVRRTLRTWG